MCQVVYPTIPLLIAHSSYEEFRDTQTHYWSVTFLSFFFFNGNFVNVMGNVQYLWSFLFESILKSSYHTRTNL